MKKILIFIFACFIVTFLAFGNRALAFSASSNTIYNGIDIIYYFKFPIKLSGF